MGRFFYKIADSWATSLLGGVAGGSILWVALRPLLDGDAATVVSWQAIGLGVAAVIAGLMARDNTKGVDGIKALFKIKK